MQVLFTRNSIKFMLIYMSILWKAMHTTWTIKTS